MGQVSVTSSCRIFVRFSVVERLCKRNVKGEWNAKNSENLYFCERRRKRNKNTWTKMVWFVNYVVVDFGFLLVSRRADKVHGSASSFFFFVCAKVSASSSTTVQHCNPFIHIIGRGSTNFQVHTSFSQNFPTSDATSTVTQLVAALAASGRCPPQNPLITRAVPGREHWQLFSLYIYICTCGG